jgi:hypothetical protein
VAGALNDTLKKQRAVSKLEFQHMDQLKGMWRAWTDQMLNFAAARRFCPAGSGTCGTGRKTPDGNKREGELVKLGTKMKSESEAGYEPSLLIEMEGIQTADARPRKSHAKKGSIVHHAYVLKDRWRTLNGRVFHLRGSQQLQAGRLQEGVRDLPAALRQAGHREGGAARGGRHLGVGVGR